MKIHMTKENIKRFAGKHVDNNIEVQLPDNRCLKRKLKMITPFELVKILCRA